ncbi:MAG: VanW family protein [Patescibacteria group bacterium]
MPIRSTEHPVLYRASVARHRLRRYATWAFSRPAKTRPTTETSLPYRVAKHKSVLLRKLGSADMRLQHNKITNLTLASQKINRVQIRPGETFSIWRLVGKPTAQKGYVTGLLLSDGEVKEGIGGGLCQMANLLYWMALHTPLTIVERNHHSFDAFPDSGRVLPFGSGATLFYNYMDLQFRNDTAATFEIRVWLDDEFLQGEIRSSALPPETYSIIERDHRFIFDERDGHNYRENKIFRETRVRATGVVLKDELVCANHSRMKYEPPADAKVVRVTA